MAHVTKYTKAAAGHICKHYERAKDENGEYLKFNNQDIIPDKTPQNYNLAPERDGGQMEFIHTRCREVKCLNRKDVNVMCCWIVTVPQNIAGNAEAQRVFFHHTYQFLTARYGAENTISAHVHMDETTPHLHFAFVPVFADRKTRSLKVSAKEVVGRRDLQSFHTDLDRHLSKTMGSLYQGGILNGATAEGNRSIEALKRQSAAERLSRAENQSAKIREEAEKKVRELAQQEQSLSDSLASVREELRAAQRQTAAYNGVIATANDIDVMGKKTVFGDKVVLTADEAKRLKTQALAYWSAKSEAKSLNDTVDRLYRRYANMEELERKTVPELRRQVRVLTMERDQISKTLLKTLAVIESNPELKQAFDHQQNILEQRESAHQKQNKALDYGFSR